MSTKTASFKRQTPKLSRNTEHTSHTEKNPEKEIARHRTTRKKNSETELAGSESKDRTSSPERFPKKEGKLKSAFRRKSFPTSQFTLSREPESPSSKHTGGKNFDSKVAKDALPKDTPAKSPTEHSETSSKGSRKNGTKKSQRRSNAGALANSMKDIELSADAATGDAFTTISDYNDSFFLKDTIKEVRQCKADFLDGTVLGIDVRYWLRRLEPHRKPLFPFTKPYDIGQKECITKNILLQELLRFRDLNVTVLLVFNGMDQDAVQTLKESQSMASAEVSRSGPKDARKRIAHKPSSKGARFECDSVINELLEICWEYRSTMLSHVQCIRAPGDALSQLGYYHKLSLIHNVFGPPWLFWANASIPLRIIVDIRDDDVYVAERTPRIDSMTAKTRIDPILLKEDGQLSGVSVPARFPTETMLLHLAVGLLSPSLLNTSLTTKLSDEQPQFDSRELRNFLEYILPTRTHAIRLILKGHRNYSHVSWNRWFGQSVEVALPPAIELAEWAIESSIEEQEYREPPNFVSAIELIDTKTFTRSPYIGLYQYSNALHLKFLDVLGYLAHNDRNTGRQKLSSCRRGVYSEALFGTHPMFAESMVVFIELVRIRGFPWTPLQNAIDFSFFETPFKYQTNAGHAGVDEMDAVVLSRLFSFAPIEFEDDMLTYEDIASQDLKAFWEILQTMRATLLDLSETISVVELPIVELPESFLHDAFGYIPFKKVTSPLLGAVMEHVIVISRSGKFQEKTKEEKIQHLKNKFPHIKNLPYVLSTGFQWIEEVLRVVQHLFEYMEDEEPQSIRQYVCHLLKMLRQTKFYAEKIRQQLFD
uniref:Post-transcriptional regulator MKT1 C-terminal domain-containing protein n=2 Tax=Paramoeba aestuarina TaxID=180227 RepID=A0A7S4KH43_9EUKA|mmetsp:Transcript_19/g.39  ORF Transcript_19/g.39 Transcript_19/m.39 type:complete len:821 (+) Transcript_19:30-2492(+)